jgi:plastocyanin
MLFTLKRRMRKMKTKLMLSAIVFASVFTTGCHYFVLVKVDGSTVTAHKRKVNNGDTVSWIFPSSPWLVQFLDDSPCGNGGSVHVIQSGATETCTIGDLSKGTYKYYAIALPNISADPQIYHNPTFFKPAKPKPTTTAAPTLVCLNLASSPPSSCSTATKVYPGDDVYWEPIKGNWTITIDPGICGDGGTQTTITSAQGICSVGSTAMPSTYSYTVVMNGYSPGPYQIQVSAPTPKR